MFDTNLYAKDSGLLEFEHKVFKNFSDEFGVFYDKNSLVRYADTILDLLDTTHQYFFDKSEEFRNNLIGKTYIGEYKLLFIIEAIGVYESQSCIKLYDKLLLHIQKYSIGKNKECTDLYKNDKDVATYNNYMHTDKEHYQYASKMYKLLSTCKVKNMETYATINYQVSDLVKGFLTEHVKIYLNNEDRYKHTYITGQSGSGKSELLKHLIYSTYKEESENFILIDPHGDLADDIFKLYVKEVNVKSVDEMMDNLGCSLGTDTIFVDPFYHNDKVPIINPMEFYGTEDEMFSYTEELISVFQEILGQDFSLNAETLLSPCISILLQIEGSSLYDLQLFMDDENNEKLVNIGKQSANIAHRNFFHNGFYRGNLSSTKNALYSKLQNLLNNPVFSNFTTGKSTIDLEYFMNNGGNIIFKFSKQKMKQSLEPLGRFIVAKVQSIALKRASLPERDRYKTHLYIDEFQNFITPSIEEILTESRKYKLFVTLAHQVISQLEKTKLRDVILSNTNVKFVGQNGYKTLTALQKEISAPIEIMQKLGVGEFILKIGKSQAVPFASERIPSDYFNNVEDGMQIQRKYQLLKYYVDKNRSTDIYCISEDEEQFTNEMDNIKQYGTKTPKYDSF